MGRGEGGSQINTNVLTPDVVPKGEKCGWACVQRRRKKHRLDECVSDIPRSPREAWWVCKSPLLHLLVQLILASKVIQ